MPKNDNSKSEKEDSNTLKILYRAYLGILLLFWFFSSFTLFDSSTFSAIYPFIDGGILDIVELTLYGGLPFIVYKIIIRKTGE